MTRSRIAMWFVVALAWLALPATARAQSAFAGVVKDATGATLVSDVPLIEDGCNTLPYDLNACVLRTRSDAPPPGWGEE